MFKHLINRARQSTYLKNVLTLSSGTTFAQLISVGTAPVLYRIYSREDYGTLGLYMAICGVLGVFSTMQMSEVILLETEEKKALIALWLNRLINLLISLLSLLLIIPLNQTISEIFGNPNIQYWLYLIPISLFFSGQNAILRVWANRKKRYRLLSLNSIISSISIPLFSILLGYLYSGPMGLFIGLLIGQIVPSLFLLVVLNRRDPINSYSGITSKNLSSAFTRFRKFPMYNLPAELMSRVSIQAPVFFLSSLFGPSIVGLYNLTTRMLGLPVQVIGGAFGEVFRQRATQDLAQIGNCVQIFRKTFGLLGALGLLMILVISIMGPFLFGFVFGEEWYEAGIIAQVLVWMYALKCVVSPLSFTYIIREKLIEDMLLHIWILASTLLIFSYGLYSGIDYIRLLLIYAINYSIIYLVYLIRSYQLARGEIYE